MAGGKVAIGGDNRFKLDKVAEVFDVVEMNPHTLVHVEISCLGDDDPDRKGRDAEAFVGLAFGVDGVAAQLGARAVGAVVEDVLGWRAGNFTPLELGIGDAEVRIVLAEGADEARIDRTTDGSGE